MAMDGTKSSSPARKVMLVADATRESAAALQYTLSHAILENDTLILLHVESNNFWRNTLSFFRKPVTTNQIGAPVTENAAAGGAGLSGGGGSGLVDLSFLEAMKQVCEKAQSKIQVTIEVVEMDGKDKANVILAQCTEHGIDLLIIGQRRSLSNAILGKQMRNGTLRGIDTAEYLIEKCKCTCVAVQKKGQNAGYLLNTKTLKEFWLLA